MPSPTTIIPADLEATAAEYQQLRPLMTELHTEIGKLVRKDAILACAKRLRMLSRQNGKKVVLFEDEFEMDIRGWDLDFDGNRVAVCQGSSGVQLFAIIDDRFMRTQHVDFPMTTYGVALDGDRLWAAAWSGTTCER